MMVGIVFGTVVIHYITVGIGHTGTSRQKSELSVMVQFEIILG